jgi:hypothetical protein
MCKKMMSIASMCTYVAFALCGLTQTAAAGDLGGVVVVALDGSGDYTCIQAAINDYSVTEILVMPGMYVENILITKDLTIRAYDGPLMTILDGSKHRRWTKGCGGQSVAQDNVVEINKALNVTIEGLCVTNGMCGVNILDDDRVTLRNCVFWANQNHGIQIQDNWTWEHGPRTTIYNCICVDNGASGIFIGQYHHAGMYGSDDHCPFTLVRNSILVANGQYGLRLSEPDRISEATNVSLDYNCCTGNTTSNYGPGIGPGQTISAGAHSFTDSPYFIQGNAGDFRLASWSPCIDAGAPGSGFMDPDGTTNDVGAYGGPGAATFFENPTDGPIVRELTVTPGSVAQGSTLRIRAKGSVR